jgi:phosphoglucomutase
VLEGSQAPRGNGPRSADVEAVLQALKRAQLKQKQGPQMLHVGGDGVGLAERISERIWRMVHAANGHERG